MTVYRLYHSATWKAESESLAWIKDSAMQFHGSRLARDVFIVPVVLA